MHHLHEHYWGYRPIAVQRAFISVMIFVGRPRLHKSNQSASRSIESKAALRSMFVIQSGCWNSDRVQRQNIILTTFGRPGVNALSSRRRTDKCRSFTLLWFFFKQFQFHLKVFFFFNFEFRVSVKFLLRYFSFGCSIRFSLE